MLYPKWLTSESHTEATSAELWRGSREGCKQARRRREMRRERRRKRSWVRAVRWSRCFQMPCVLKAFSRERGSLLLCQSLGGYFTSGEQGMVIVWITNGFARWHLYETQCMRGSVGSNKIVQVRGSRSSWLSVGQQKWLELNASSYREPVGRCRPASVG